MNLLILTLNRTTTSQIWKHLHISINASQKWKFFLARIKKIVGKGEDAGYQYFLRFPQNFLKTSFSGSLKARIVW